MKTLYFIGGPMGVGKTTVCQHLKKRLPKAVFLDGDWCWDADPFTVTEKTKKMVMDNITHLLQNFLDCSAYENIIFCWVLHQDAIIDSLIEKLHGKNHQIKKISLVASPEVLTERLLGDIEKGVRQPDVIERSLERLPLYEALHTIKVDVSDLTPIETADKLMQIAS